MALFHDIKGELNTMYPKKCDKYIDKYLVAGNEIKSMMTKYLTHIDEEKIDVIGDPRFDLLKKRYYPFWESENNKLKRKYGDFILINTNFATGNPKVGLKNIINFYNSNPDYSRNIRKKYLHKTNFIRDVMFDYIKVIKKLSNNYAKLNFIVRPHPSEDKTIYEKEFRNFKNIFITNEDNVTNWILASKVIQYDCTTGIEAILAKKFCISYIPKVDKKIIAWLPVRLSNQAKQFTSLCRLINLSLQKPEFELNKKSSNLLNKYLYNYRRESSQKIVEIINLVNAKNRQLVKKDTISFVLLKRRFKSFVVLLLYNLGLYKEKNGMISLNKFG